MQLSIRDNLNKMLEAPTAGEKKYTPSTVYDGSVGHIQTGTMKATDPVSYTDLLKQFGYDPDAVQIVGSVRTSRWQQREDGEWLVAYRFNIAPRFGPDSIGGIGHRQERVAVAGEAAALQEAANSGCFRAAGRQSQCLTSPLKLNPM